MSLFARLFRPQVELPERLAARVRAWREQPTVSERTSIETARLIVVDVETSGLNARRDRLLAIGAVGLAGRRLRASDVYQAYVRVETPSAKENILVHGISPDVQTAGVAPEEALMSFLEYAGRDLLVAYHADFDRTVLDRAAREHLGVRLLNPWIDLARLAPALVPEARLPHAALDEWLEYFGLRAHVRHRALDDAFVTAELALILLARAAARGQATLAELRGLADVHHSISPGWGMGGA